MSEDRVGDVAAGESGGGKRNEREEGKDFKELKSRRALISFALMQRVYKAGIEVALISTLS